MAAPYPPKAVANAFLQRAFNDRKTIGHLKLQKLVYLAHGYFLAMTNGTPMVNEPFEAWDYGPVCRSLYTEFRDNGKSPIDRLATDLDFDAGAYLPVPTPENDKIAEKVIDFVYKTYVDRSPFSLSDLTHQENWAWDRTRKEDKFGLKNKDIVNDWIMTDFKPHVKSKVTQNA